MDTKCTLRVCADGASAIDALARVYILSLFKHWMNNIALFGQIASIDVRLVVMTLQVYAYKPGKYTCI